MANILDLLGGLQDQSQTQPDPNDIMAWFRQKYLSANLPNAPAAPAAPAAAPSFMTPPAAQSGPMQAPLKPIAMSAPVPQPTLSPVSAPQPPQSLWDRLMTRLQDPGASRALMAAGASLLQSGGTSSKPVGIGEALGGAVQQGTGAYDSFQNQQEQDAARKQKQAGDQWTTLSPDDAKKAGLTASAPGYVWQRNGNGEVKQVGQDVIKTVMGPMGQTLQDIRKPLPKATATSGAYDPATLDAAATVVMSDPTRIRDYASFGKEGQAVREQIQNTVTQKLKDAGMTPADLVAMRARAHAETGNLSTLTKQQAQLQSADQLIHANGDRLLQLFDLVDQTGVPMIEGISRSARAKMGGVDPAELQSVLTTFQSEVARQLSGNPNMTGVVSDSLRDEINKMAPGSMSTEQAKRIINRLYLETGIRQQANQQQIDKGVNTSVVGGQPTQPAAQPQAGITPQPAPNSNDPLGIR